MKACILMLGLVTIAAPLAQAAEPAAPRKPVVDGDWRRVCEMPDLGELNGPDARKQHIVDHGFVRGSDGLWRLWACLRGTEVSRLLYGWSGESLERVPWQPIGIVARAEERFGEQIRIDNGKRAETMGAPFFMRDGDRYLCFYHSAGIRLMTSTDGANFKRADLGGERGNLLYRDGGRDVMVLKIGDFYHAYSTISTRDRQGYVILKTSPDLREWSKTKIVSRGGIAGDGPVSAESPFVVSLDGYYYLFRASSITFKTYVYRSPDPADFGVGDDSKLIATLPIKAPELIHVGAQWYISDLADFQGIKLAKLKWQAE